MKITRREFLRMAAYTAAVAGVSQFDIFKLQKAIAANKPPVIWFEGLGDSGCVVSLANYFDGVSAGIESVLLNNIELKFSSVLMGAAGQLSIDVAEAVYDDYASTPYVLVLTGGLSNIDGYCVVGEDGVHGNGIMQLVEAYNKWEERAAYVLNVGACACYGGVNSIRGNIASNDPQTLPPTHNGPPTYPGTRNTNYDYSKTLYIPGCPAHPDWIVLSIVDILTNGTLPARDDYGRPLSLLGTPIFANTVHSQCPRKPEHDAGNFADSVGDPVKCLRKVGCRGKDTFADCPTRGWNSVGSFCNKPGINHLCIGCVQPFFADVPFNREIDDIDITP